MAQKCLEEFNPWPSFVDIFSSVILVLLLFLLVLIINIVYYAQFKYKVSYDGSLSQTEVILSKIEPMSLNTSKSREQNDATSNNKDDIVLKSDQSMQAFMDAATGEEESGENIGDSMKNDIKQTQDILEEEKVFYIQYNGNEIFVEEQIIHRLEIFVNKIKNKYPSAKLQLTTIDPQKEVSASITKQISLGRVVYTRLLIKNLDFPAKNIKLKLNSKHEVPAEFDSKFGLIIVKAVNKNE